MDIEYDDRYKFLMKHYTESRIVGRYVTLYNETRKFLHELGLEGKVRIDRWSFQNFILDYFTDTLRVEQFHEIEHTNVNKVYAYEMYWFLRRRPVQTLEEFPKGFYINEKTALGLFLPPMYKEAGLDYRKIRDKGAINDFVNLLFYNMKYRIFTPHSLELMVTAFLSGVRSKN